MHIKKITIVAPLMAALFAGLFSFTSPLIVQAEEAKLNAHDEALMRRQEPLIVAADHLTAKAGQAQRDGLGGIMLAVEQDEVHIYWKGTMPKAVKDEIEHQKAKVKIRVLPAQYTQSELKKEADAILNDAAAYGNVHSIAPRPDGSGLEVRLPQAKDDSKRAVKAFRLPTQIIEEPQPVPHSRRDDSPYFAAGAQISKDASGRCSSGFGAWRDRVTGGREWRELFMLSAEHCGSAAGTSYFSEGAYSDSEPRIGWVQLAARDLDAMAIRTARPSGRMYYGTVGYYEAFHSIKGVRSNYPGMYVCTSGAATGTICDIKVRATGFTLTYPDGQRVTNVVSAAHRVDSQASTGRGNSGGPVVTYVGAGAHGVGLISGGSGTNLTDCPPGDASECSNLVYYVDLQAILNRFGLNLLTAQGIYDQPRLVSVEGYYQPPQYIRHYDSHGEVAYVDPNDYLTRIQSTFWLKRGNQSTAGSALVSFESLDRRGYFLRHQSLRVKLQSYSSDSLYKADSTFKVVPGLANPLDPATVSFAPSNLPFPYHLRQRDTHLYVEEVRDGQSYSDATFRIVNPLWEDSY